MGLGDKAAALALNRRGHGREPDQKDAMNGPFSIELLAPGSGGKRVNRSCHSALQKILSIPTVARLDQRAANACTCSGSSRCSIRSE